MRDLSSQLEQNPYPFLRGHGVLQGECCNGFIKFKNYLSLNVSIIYHMVLEQGRKRGLQDLLESNVWTWPDVLGMTESDWMTAVIHQPGCNSVFPLQ